jgi:DNA-binding HxlR family transcriptional regulator
MKMAANNTTDRPRLVGLPRTDRTLARLEDFEMIERTRAALALLDSKWSVAVIILLASGIRRHARLVDNIPGLSKKVLTSTLRKLERHGIVVRHVYPEIPVRVEYTLTTLGWQLTEPLMALYEWALAHENELAGAPQHTDFDNQQTPDTARSILTLAPAPAA